MKEQDKQLLLKDICARLSYDVMVDYDGYIYILNEIDPACKDIDYITVRIQDIERLTCAKSVMIENIKPYLRPMSSMTKEEFNKYMRFIKHSWEGIDKEEDDYYVKVKDMDVYIDWLLEHHLDFRGLIEKGLALEAPEGMYKTE